MQRDKFPPGVAERLKWYVYRLIDPRNGETFYVGKGHDDRIFAHARGALRANDTEDSDDLKSKRIRDIQAAGLEVAHVIHRHGIEDEHVAYEIEATLIDAYPGLANRAGGIGNDDYGCRHVEEIISEYAAEPFEAHEPLILISINRTYPDMDVYDQVRAVWKIDVDRARKFNLVLAHRRGMVVGAFRPSKWLKGTKENFPFMLDDIPERWGFVGVPAEEEVRRFYVGRRVPDKYRPKGAANPIRFVEREQTSQ